MQVEINGRSTGPGIQWPNGCRAAVMLTFDFEAETYCVSPTWPVRKRAG